MKNSNVKIDGSSIVSRMQEIFCHEEKMTASCATRRATPEHYLGRMSSKINAMSRC